MLTFFVKYMKKSIVYQSFLRGSFQHAGVRWKIALFDIPNKKSGLGAERRSESYLL